ncbi:ABCC1 [Branchiostoma lanceolatum]|nr:ABCC1 [Branchiostoma lanceolatum]
MGLPAVRTALLLSFYLCVSTQVQGQSKCPDGYRHFRRHCYMFSDFPVNNLKAEAICARDGGKLAVVSGPVYQFLAEATNRFRTPHWVGMPRRKVKAKPGYNVWPKTPNDSPGNENRHLRHLKTGRRKVRDCILMYQYFDSYTWRPFACSTKAGYICQLDPAAVSEGPKVPIGTEPLPQGVFSWCQQEENRNSLSCILERDYPDRLKEYTSSFSAFLPATDQDVHIVYYGKEGSKVELEAFPAPGAGRVTHINPCQEVEKFTTYVKAENREGKVVELMQGVTRDGTARFQKFHEVTCRQSEPVLGGCSGTCTEGEKLHRAMNDSLQDTPDLTPCFQQTVLMWVPCFFLLAVAPLYVRYLRMGNRGYIQMSRINKAKTAFAVLLVLVTSLDLFKALADFGFGEVVPSVYFVTPLVLTITMGVASFLIQYERLKGTQSSGVLFIFWLLATLCGIVTFYSKISALSKGGVDDIFRFVTFYVYFTLVLIQLILSTVSERPPLFSKINSDPNRSPEEYSSFLSRMTFLWFTPLVVLGYKRSLVTTDLHTLSDCNKSENIVPEFEKELLKEIVKYKREKKEEAKFKNKKVTEAKDKSELENLTKVETAKGGAKHEYPSLYRALVRYFLPTFITSGVFKLCADILMFVSPQILGWLIAFTRDKSAQPWKGYLLAVLLLMTTMLQSLLTHQFGYRTNVWGMRVKTVVTAAIYKKALLLTNGARKNLSVGNMVNLMTSDVTKLQMLCQSLHSVWAAPLQIVVAMYFLWRTLGPSILAGLGVMVLLIPVNGVIASGTRKQVMKLMKKKDSRLKLLSEVLNGIKVLKLYAWELSFKEKIEALRRKELQHIRKKGYFASLFFLTWSGAPILVALTAFAVYVMVDERNVLDAEKAFVALSLFNIVRAPLNMLPSLLTSIIQVKVSLRRLGEFFGGDELDPENVHKETASGRAISVYDGTFSWGKEEDPILKNVNLSIPGGALVAVIGQVGSGKSSLLSALLGEMETQGGRIAVMGTTAYVPQQAWIQNATLRDNILFGIPMNHSRYNEVLEACALGPDLEMLPAGDNTEIGEKGINLSGGQKQRVSLARAVYNDASIYYLDDPLSAVDTHVGKHIFDKVIGPNGLLKGKTRVLVTHGISFLPQCDQITALVDGRIWLMGTYRQLLAQNEAFADFIRNYGNFEEEKDDDSDAEDTSGEAAPLPDKQRDTNEENNKDDVTKKSNGNVPVKVPADLSDRPNKGGHENGTPIARKDEPSEGKKIQLPEKKDKLIEKEKSKTGKVKASVYMAYVKSAGVILPIIGVLGVAAQQATLVGSNFWLSAWSDDDVINGTQNAERRNVRLGVYGALGMGQALVATTGAFCLILGGVRSSRTLHKTALLHVLRGSLQYFDVTPLGRIVNRFSQDMNNIDNSMPSLSGMVLNFIFSLIGTIVVISITTPIFLAVLLPVAVLYFFIQRFYIATSRQLQRLEAVSRSPIYSHFSETLQGTSVIRAYGRADQFGRENQTKVDDSQAAAYLTIIATRWLSLGLDVVSNIIIFSATMFAVLGRESLTPGLVGLSITYALQVTLFLGGMVRVTSQLEATIVAVERLKEYEETNEEAEWSIDDNRPPDSWPSEGKIRFNSYQTRYREGLDLVLSNITVDIGSGEKIGIVGRTGSGKSSLALALFRIIESAGGDIVIDGINISKIGLHDLRSRISIIPQDPVLFSGTLRMNLDPFGKHNDVDIWLALQQSHLKNFVMNLEKKLEHDVTEGGENLSVGQRQLVCLARALLRKSKILVLDEATAAVDLETDDLIQSTIRTQFADCTVLTIAHRLNTIMDSTR